MSNGTASSDALTQMVRAALEQQGLSYQAAADRAIDPEGGEAISASTVHKLATGKMTRAPEARVLRALAAGFGLPLPKVQRAAAEQWLQYTGSEMSGLPEDVRVILGHLEGMEPAELSRARAVIEALGTRLNDSSSDAS
ncbi:helix-turn-helix domain-containing protein [Kitasatospora mediocidica]|uniref:helix-turn-helix domain-containing protein n=1 Tax=Kitasatospora mediocidica TaxID=58352 RepID=UPI00068935BA|nr:helix-turn-helix transcriptional regulator [Kitasatospora mediocidica]